MSCKLEKNEQGKIVNVLDQTNKPSKLFKQILNVPTLSLNEAIDVYKNIYSDKLKDKVQVIFNNIEGRFLNRQQADALQKEIESNYANTANELVLDRKNDIRTNIFNLDNPIAEKNVNRVSLKIIEGLIRDKRKTYLLYADNKIIGEFYSVQDIKNIVSRIESSLIKEVSLEGVLKSVAENNGTKFSVGEKTPGELTQEVIDRLKQSGLSEDVFLLSTEEIDTKLKELGRENIKNITNGFVYKNQVFLNTDVATDETSLHEFNHLFNSWLKENKKELYNKGIDLVKEELEKKNSSIKNIISYVKNTQSELEGEALYEEILAELTGRRGAELLNFKKKSGIIDWLKEFWSEIKNMLGILDTTPEQVSKMTLKEFADASAVQMLKGENFVGKNGETNFNKWKGENELVSSSEIQDVRTGQPIVAKVYHGTTNEFYEFDSSVKGNIEGHLGKVNYFTSDYGDANQNYLSEGADITGRIDRRQDELEDTLRYDYQSSEEGLNFQEIIDDFNITDEEVENLYPSGKPEFIQAEEISRFLAEKELKGGTEQVLELYVKLNNPVVLGNGATWFDALEIDEVYLEEATQEIAEEYDITEEEAKSDYEWEIRDRAVEKQGDGNKVIEALERALEDNGYSTDSASEILGDKYYESEVDLNELEKTIRTAELYENYDNEMASSQVIADFFKNLGFDGIILTDVSDRFRNMGLGSDTSHIHVFDEFSNQIKLADGSNVTFGETVDIRYQKTVVEPNLSFETPSGEIVDSYQKAIQKTDEGSIKLNIENVNVGEVSSDINVDTFEGTINYLVKSGGLTGKRYLDKNGEVVYETMGKSDTAKQITANLIEEQLAKLLGQRSIKRLKNGDFVIKDNINKITVNGEEYDKKDIDALDYAQLTEKFGRETALRIELMREYSKALQPTKTKKRLEEVSELKTEDELITSIKSLLNRLGISITSIEDYIKNNKIKNNNVDPSADALMDVVNKIMAFRDGTITREDLIEETMHLIEATIDPRTTEGLRKNIDKTEEWRQYSEHYFNIYSKEYSGDKLDEMVRREILGKVMANAVMKNFALEQDATLTKQSIFAKIKDLLQQFFDRINTYFKPEYQRQIDALNNDIYAKLISGSIYNEMNLDQNFGSKFRLYSSSNNVANDIVMLQKQAEKALDVLNADKKTEANKSVLSKAVRDALGQSAESIKNQKEKQAKVELIATFSKIVNMVQRQTNYLDRVLKKAESNKHPFSAEEMAVYMNLVNQFDANILPTVVETIKSQKILTNSEKKIIEEIERLQGKISTLKGRVGTNGFNAKDYVVRILSERLGLDNETEKFLQEQVSSTQIEANWFFMQFGNLSHSSNIFLNALGHVITKTDYDKRQGFMDDIKPFIEKLANLDFLKGGKLSEFIKGSYIQSTYDFEAIEKATLNKKYELYYNALKERVNDVELLEEDRAIIQSKIDNPVSLEEFSKIEVFDDLDVKTSQKIKRDLETWEMEQFKLTPFYADEHAERRRKLEQYSETTRNYILQRSANYSAIYNMAETINGKQVVTADMKYEFEQLKKEEVEARSIFDADGNLKKGYRISDNSNPEAIEISKDFYVTFNEQEADTFGVLSYELNKIAKERLELAKSKNSNNTGFSNDFKDILNSLDSEEAYEFLTLNSYISYAQEYYDSFSGDTFASKLEDVKDGDNDADIESLIQDIQENTKKINTIIQANKVMNNPSEVNFDMMEGNEIKSVKEYAQELEYLYQKAKKYLPKEEQTEQEERITEVKANRAFFNYLVDSYPDVFEGGVVPDFTDEDLLSDRAKTVINKILSEIVNHTTENKKREILDLKREVERFSKGTQTKFNKLHQRVFSVTEDDLKNMSEEEIFSTLTKDLLKYSYSKLLPYFKKTQPIDADIALSDLEAGLITPSEFISNYEAGNYKYLQISPNYAFQEATDNNNKNPHFEYAKDNGTPMFRIFEKGVQESDLIGKSVEQLLKEGKINKFVDVAYFNEYGIDLVELFKGNEVATKNKSKFEARQTLVGLQRQSLDKIGFLGRHNLYQLPQKEKSKFRKMEDFFSKGASLKSLVDEIKNFREDELETGQDNTLGKHGKTTATLDNLSVPVFGVRKLKEAPVTDDLLESYVWMNYKANEHKSRKDNYQDAFNIGIAAFGDDFGYKTSSEAGNNYKMFKEAMDYNFYGIKEVWSQKINLPVVGSVDIARVLQNFGKWIRLRNLGFTLISPITSATTGFTFKGIEKLIGENIDKDAEAISNKFFRKHAGEASLEMLNLESKTVLNSLGELYGWYEPLERYENTKYSKALRGLGKSPFAAHQLANFPVNTRVGLSVLANHRFVEGKLIEYREYKKLFAGRSDKEIRETWRKQVSVLDVVKLEKDGRITYDYARISEALNNGFTEEEAKEFINMKNSSVIRGRIKASIQKIDGAISEEDRSMSTRNAFFSFVNIHRSWLFIALQNKFKKRQFNTQTGYFEEGSWRSVGGYFMDLLKSSKDKGFLTTLTNIREDFKNYDEVTKRNIVRTLYELAVLQAFVGVMAMAMKELEDDDEDSYLFKVSSLFLIRTTNELASSTVALHKNVEQTLNNVIVGLNSVETFTQSPDVLSSEIVARGRYKGLTERERYMFKHVPVMRDYNNLFRDIEGNIKSYNYHNFVKDENLGFSIYPFLQDDK